MPHLVSTSERSYKWPNPLPTSTHALPVSRFECARIDLAIASLLDNQPAASESERARD